VESGECRQAKSWRMCADVLDVRESRCYIRDGSRCGTAFAFAARCSRYAGHTCARVHEGDWALSIFASIGESIVVCIHLDNERCLTFV